MKDTRNRNQSAAEANLPAQPFDLVTRIPFYKCPDDLLSFLMAGRNCEFVDHVDSEIATVEVRRMDILMKVLLDGQHVLIHCEIQTGDSVQPNMVRRNVGYLGRCYERYGLPIYSFVIYLKETAGMNDPGGYIQNVQGHRFIVEYKVIRLSQLDGEAILQMKQPGLMPFTPLMKPPKDMSAVEWTTRCMEVTKALDIDVELRNNLIVEQWVLSGLRHARQDLIESVSEDILNDSSTYNLIIERGIERGREQGIEQGIERGRHLGGKAFAIEHILEVLNERFQVNAVAMLTPALEAIDDLDVFKGLLRSASAAEHLEDFVRTLEHNVNGTQ